MNISLQKIIASQIAEHLWRNAGLEPEETLYGMNMLQYEIQVYNIIALEVRLTEDPI